MVKSLVFHIGDPKTGTTSIQDALAMQNWTCAGPSVVYPARLNDIPLSKTFYDDAHKGENSARMLKLAARLAASNADIAVISAETFEHADPADVKSAIKTYLPTYANNVRVIAYVRPHADRLVSTYAERLKHGFFSGSLDELHERIKSAGNFQYYPRFSKWREAFGPAFELRLMSRDRLYQQDVVQDFLSFVLGHTDFTLNDDQGSNESLSLEDLAMLREFHLLVRNMKMHKKLAPARMAVGWNFGRLLAEMPRKESTRLRLHRALVPDVIETYREDAAQMDSAFFEGTPLSDALLDAGAKAVDEPQSCNAEDHFSKDELRYIRGWSNLIADMLKLSPEGIPAHFRAAQAAKLREKRKQLSDGAVE
ncbi:MAG: hypothetical protein SWN98_09325 [Pseudomonadota bacterium]|nr:hypothetical protein [Pseudomonadota bacterium]